MKPKEKIELGYTERDLEDKDGVLLNLIERVEKNINYSKAILFLGLAFHNHKQGYTTIKDVSKVIGKSYDYTSKILDHIELSGVIKKINPKKGKRIKYLLENDGDFAHLHAIARKNLKEIKKKEKKDEI